MNTLIDNLVQPSDKVFENGINNSFLPFFEDSPAITERKGLSSKKEGPNPEKSKKEGPNPEKGKKEGSKTDKKEGPKPKKSKVPSEPLSPEEIQPLSPEEIQPLSPEDIQVEDTDEVVEYDDIDVDVDVDVDDSDSENNGGAPKADTQEYWKRVSEEQSTLRRNTLTQGDDPTTREAALDGNGRKRWTFVINNATDGDIVFMFRHIDQLCEFGGYQLELDANNIPILRGFLSHKIKKKLSFFKLFFNSRFQALEGSVEENIMDMYLITPAKEVRKFIRCDRFSSKVAGADLCILKEENLSKNELEILSLATSSTPGKIVYLDCLDYLNVFPVLKLLSVSHGALVLSGDLELIKSSLDEAIREKFIPIVILIYEDSKLVTSKELLFAEFINSGLFFSQGRMVVTPPTKVLILSKGIPDNCDLIRNSSWNFLTIGEHNPYSEELV